MREKQLVHTRQFLDYFPISVYIYTLKTSLSNDTPFPTMRKKPNKPETTGQLGVSIHMDNSFYSLTKGLVQARRP